MKPEPQRYLPGREFPPYAYVGDPQPHPRNDPRGHSFGLPEPAPPRLDSARWRESEEYLRGIDLFNHGYYWESHESWEGLWNAERRRGPVAEFLKGLIKLAAAGVKARGGQPDGVRRHAQRAREHFRRAREGLVAERFAGLSFVGLEEMAEEIARRAGEWPRREGETAAAVFDRFLAPQDR